MPSAGPLRGIPRRRIIGAALLAVLVSAIGWYLGADAWHAVLFGVVLTTAGLAGTARLDAAATDWTFTSCFEPPGSRLGTATTPATRAPPATTPPTAWMPRRRRL